MKKVLLITATAVVLTGGAVAAYVTLRDSDSKNQTSNASQNTQKVDLSVEDAANELNEAGFNLVDKSVPYYQTVGATDGAKYTLGNEESTDGIVPGVELYTFADQKALKEAEEQLSSSGATLFSTGNLLVLVHSTDQELTGSIRNALE